MQIIKEHTTVCLIMNWEMENPKRTCEGARTLIEAMTTLEENSWRLTLETQDKKDVVKRVDRKKGHQTGRSENTDVHGRHKTGR